MSNKQYAVIVLIVVFSILGAFYSGYFLKELVLTKSNVTDTEQRFRPNFIDEVIIITKDKPQKALILSAIRTFVNKDSNNYTLKAFYFNGESWVHNITEGKTKELENIPETLSIPKWKIDNDPSYMLKQTISGEVIIDGDNIKFDIPLINNEMGIRSSYKYTKFMSEAKGRLTINNEDFESNVVYSRIYSFSPPESLIFTSDPSGIETEWLAFWDNENNFYSIDETTIDNKKTLDTYKAHSLGILKDKDGKVQKSFTLDLKKNDFKDYSVQIKEGIDKTISVNKLNSVNKSVNQTDFWTTGIVEGEVKIMDRTISGFGIFEQISQ